MLPVTVRLRLPTDCPVMVLPVCPVDCCSVISTSRPSSPVRFVIQKSLSTAKRMVLPSAA
jgi:hypothetical protein